MLQIWQLIVQVVAWAAVATSVAALAALWREGDVRPGWLVAWATLSLAAAWCQFFGPTALVSALGLAVQTFLAIGLLLAARLPS